MSEDNLATLIVKSIPNTPIKYFDKDGEDKTCVAIAGDGDSTKSMYLEALKNVLGVKDEELAILSISAGANALTGTLDRTDALNMIAQSVNDCKPQNILESRLAIQSSVLFNCAMNILRKSEQSDQIPQADYYTNKALKLMRLHNETVTILQKLKNGGEQKVTVTHAVITEKAIVNNFNGGGVECSNKGKRSCKSQDVVQKRKPEMANPVEMDVYAVEDAGCTAEKAQGLKPLKG